MPLISCYTLNLPKACSQNASLNLSSNMLAFERQLLQLGFPTPVVLTRWKTRTALVPVDLLTIDTIQI